MSKDAARAADTARRPFDAGDAEHVAERNAKSGERDTRRLNGLKVILDNPDARLWLWDVLEFCGIGRTSFTGNSTTFFNEGQRNVGLKIQGELMTKFPERYMAMMKENS